MELFITHIMKLSFENGDISKGPKVAAWAREKKTSLVFIVIKG